jgi:hypothetical protein
MKNLSLKPYFADSLDVLTEAKTTEKDDFERIIKQQLAQPGLVHEFFIRKFEELPAKLSFPQQTLTYFALAAARRSENKKKLLVWLGSETWPTPFIIRDFCSGVEDTAKVLERCLLLDIKKSEQLIFAVKILRSKACSTLIADFDRLDFSASRKLALAAKAGNSIALISRPDRDKYNPSLAYSRWKIEPTTTAPLNSTKEIHCLFEAHQQATLLKIRGFAEEYKAFNLFFKKPNDQETLSMHILSHPEANNSNKSSKFVDSGTRSILPNRIFKT